jgi:hypothetical protein
MTYSSIWVVWLLIDATIVFRLLGRPGAIFSILLRPVLAGVLMVLVLALTPWPEGLPLAVTALLKVATGGAVYVGVLGGIWWARGRPDGPESTLLEQLPRGLGRRLLPKQGARPQVKAPQHTSA